MHWGMSVDNNTRWLASYVLWEDMDQAPQATPSLQFKSLGNQST